MRNDGKPELTKERRKGLTIGRAAKPGGAGGAGGSGEDGNSPGPGEAGQAAGQAVPRGSTAPAQSRVPSNLVRPCQIQDRDPCQSRAARGDTGDAPDPSVFLWQCPRLAALRSGCCRCRGRCASRSSRNGSVRRPGSASRALSYSLLAKSGLK